MKKIKVLEVIDTYYPTIDGAISVVKNFTKNLNDNEGVECEIAAPTAKRKLHYVDNETFKVIRCKSLSAPENYRFALPFLDRKFRKEIKNGGYDIIHVHSPFTMGRFAVRVAKKLKIPVVATLHTKYYDDFLRSTQSRLLAGIALKYSMWVYKNADYVWTVSSGAERVLRSYGYDGNIDIIDNGTDYVYPKNADQLIEKINDKHGLKGQQNVFCFVGRMAMYKNLKLVCEGLRKLKDSGADFKMLFVGGGFDLKTLQEYAKQVGIDDKCIFTGEVADREMVQAYYLRADLMLFPSTFDMLSLTKFEAAVHKKAMLFVEGSNSSDGIIDGRNGFLCKETSESFGDKLIEISQKGAEYMRAAGEMANKEVYRNWKDVTDEVLVRYDNLIKNYRENLEKQTAKKKARKKRLAKSQNS